MKAANKDRNASGTQWTGDINCTRELVRLDADEPDKSKPIGFSEPRQDIFHFYARICFVNNCNIDRDINPEDLTHSSINRERVHHCEGVGRNEGPHPLDNVPIVVVGDGLISTS